MLLLVLGCSLPPASSAADSAAPHDSGAAENKWDICGRSLEGDVSGTYLVDGEALGGCEGQISLWCDGGIRGGADLVCGGSGLQSLTLALDGVQVGSELGGKVAITGEEDPVLTDWAAYVADDLSVVGGFATSGGPIDGHYDLSGAFAVGVESPL
jgi:hypothetical protein